MRVTKCKHANSKQKQKTNKQEKCLTPTNESSTTPRDNTANNKHSTSPAVSKDNL